MTWVTYYRAVVIGRPVGPWRRDRRQARRDLIAINLGEYDADGIFYCIVPGDIATRRGTSIAAGKYITRRVFAEIVTDGAGYSATSIEYRITRFLTVLSQVSSRGRTGANVRFQRDY